MDSRFLITLVIGLMLPGCGPARMTAISDLDMEMNEENSLRPGAMDEDPAWSPDGGRLVFVSRRDGNKELYEIKPNGKDLIRLTQTREDEDNPSWFRDGGALLFERNGGIVRMDLSGHRESQVVDGRREEASRPVGSPDGEWVAYLCRGPEGGVWELCRIKADGTQEVRLTHSGRQHDNPGWLPGGRWISFESDSAGNWDIFRIGMDQMKVERLTDSPGGDSDPAWSPDGTKMAYVSRRQGSSDIFVSRSDGSEPVRITEHPAEDHLPVWSPDGRDLAFVSGRDGHDELYRFSFEKNLPERLTFSGKNGVRLWHPSYSPDGARISFVSNRSGEYNIWIYDLIDGGSHPVTGKANTE